MLIFFITGMLTMKIKRQFRELKYFFLGHADHRLHNMLEFAHIALPFIFEEELAQFFGNAFDILSINLIEIINIIIQNRVVYIFYIFIYSTYRTNPFRYSPSG